MSIPFVDLKSQYLKLKKDIDNNISRVLDHGAFVLGPEVAELEKKLADYTGAKYALTCSSGTDALSLALLASDIKAGDEVITTAFSFIATAETIVLLGAVPVFVDIEPDTFNIDPTKLEAALSDKTKAIMPVSLYGQIPNMNEINDFAKSNNLAVIEDAAQSFGAEYNGKKSCNLSEYACTSFFPAKPLGCYGDGGAVFTDSEENYKKLVEIRNHGQESRYYHTRIGINGRMDTLQCAIMLAKMESYDWEVSERQKLAAKYNEAFSNLKNVQIPVVRDDRNSVWAQYTLKISDRKSFQEKMQAAGVPTSVHYPITMADQPAYKENSRTMDIAEARKAADEVISLPMHPFMKDEDFNTIVNAVKNSLG